MKTLKKAMLVLLAVLMLSSLFTVAVSACTVPVQRTEAASYCVSRPSYEDVTYALAVKIAESANASIETLVREAQAAKNPNIFLLVMKTEMISRGAVSVIRSMGYDAECEYVTYEIGGRLVEIDPIIVIKRK